ncbi:MAG: 4Fe-4S dicluster domain-containing protein [Thermoplasmata archaeon]|nr:MAG: 4Fe-4S dicluster domain-containing protein [Thermoplasmata archaeon]MCD6146663.1 4Fe-4S binding protein [Thermoplasmata archaeon]RLF62508.1 MAG: (4Fe-4S)-binding protein [Thermoplasmata archaeon]
MKEYEKTGVIALNEIRIPSEEQLKRGVAITECVQEIPCNPCVDACPVDAISMENINSPPFVDYDKCTGCAQCAAVCPGLAIFVVKLEEEKALVTLPYEFLPLPEKGEEVKALDREGKEAGKAIVKRVIKKRDRTCLVTVEVDRELAMVARNIRVVK